MNSRSVDLPAGLSAPARRALAAAGVEHLEQLTGHSEAEIRALHGMGPKSIDQLGVALSDRGLSFARGGKRLNSADPTSARPVKGGSAALLPRIKFRTTVELGGKTATGLGVPDDVVSALGSGKRPPVHVTIGGHAYRTTVAPMGGRFFVPLNAQNRAAAGVAAGDEVEVEIALDIEPREVQVPADLADALAQDGLAALFFESLAFTHRKEWVQWIEEAKQAQTRTTRIQKTVVSLRAGKRTH